MCKVYTDGGGIKKLYHVCPLIPKIIHSLKLVDYLHVQVDNPWYNYYSALSSNDLDFSVHNLGKLAENLNSKNQLGKKHL